MIALVVCTLIASATADGWGDVEKAARIAASAPSSPVLDRARAQRRQLDGLFDAEVTESLAAARSVEPAMALVDKASVTPLCTARHASDAATRARVLTLAEHTLAVAIVDALLDAREGRSSARGVGGIGRALSLAMIAERCVSPALEGLALSLDIHTRARFLAWHLAEQRTIDARDLATLAEQMAASGNAVSMERAVLAAGASKASLEEQKRIEALGKRVDDATRERAALGAASSTKAFDAIERPAQFDPFAVKLVCTKSKDGALMVSRAVERAVQLRGAELIGADSQVTPLFDGRGVEVARAGPFAVSCGIEDGDLVVEVNGILTSRSDAMMAAPQRVANDGFAKFRVVRAGDVKEWTIRVEGRRP